MSKKGHVLLGMSGGLDSSVAVHLLKEQGYRVTGLTLRTYDYMSVACEEKQSGCCTIDSIYDAKNLMDSLSLDHYVMDVRNDFRESVIDNFISEYLNGRTPNPCAVCNPKIKWEFMLRKADELGCDYIATGHYARIREKKNRYILSQGIDETKDQSYFLWGLGQDVLKRTIFPLGKLRKKQVREIAVEVGLKKLSEKKESQEICFVPDNDYRSFLKSNIIGFEEFIQPGNFISQDGKILGKHKGFPFYTIGQRKGLRLAVGHPQYVTEIREKQNEIVLGTREDLAARKMTVRQVNLIKYAELPDDIDIKTKIRYRSRAVPSKIHIEGEKFEVGFTEDVYGITPGQSAVFYEGPDVVGGGIIMKNKVESDNLLPDSFK